MYKKSIFLITIYFITSAFAYDTCNDSINEKLITRYPSFVNNLYDMTKEGLREINESLWSLSKTFEQYLRPWHQFNDTPAFVRYAPHNEICYEERSFLHNRDRHTRQALESFLDQEIDRDDVPRIAFCFSGGGFRAMNLTLGFLKGAHDIGLFDGTTFMSGLSGSTWAIAPWIASNEPIDLYMNKLSDKIEGGLDHINNTEELTLFLQQLMIKVLYKQPVSAMDAYGAVLANTLLSDSGSGRMHTTLTDSHKDVIMGFLPLPIYTTIKTNKSPYEWMECSPFEIGSDDLQAYIPTWAYGRKFKYGASLDHAPEQSLGYFLGVFGSAFEVNFSDIIVHTKDQLHAIKQKLPSLLKDSATNLVELISNSPLNELRLFPSMLRNFTHNIQWSSLRDDKNICLVDAGIDFNLPFPPLLRKDRAVDIIIVYDGSGSIIGSNELKRAEAYAWRRHLKFPKIDYSHADTQLVSVFADEDPETPIVIYFPRIANPAYSTFDPEYSTQHDYCSTLNFTYSAFQFKELSGLAEFTLKQHTELIKVVIKNKIESKRLHRLLDSVKTTS